MKPLRMELGKLSEGLKPDRKILPSGEASMQPDSKTTFFLHSMELTIVNRLFNPG